MELWKETVNKVYLEGESSWTVSATWSKDGGTATSLPVTFNTTEGRWTATLPYILDECTVEIQWSFTVPSSGSFVKTDSYEVITPLLTKREINDIWPEATDKEVKEVESVVRYIIQSHTGQSFGSRVKTRTIAGNGSTALELPERLERLDAYSTLYYNLDTRAAIIVGEGWYIKKRWSETTPVSPQPDELYFTGSDDDPGPWTEDTYRTSDGGYAGGTLKPRGPVISWETRTTTWKDDYPFTITGLWGYKTVPEAIKEAAKLLVNDYACAEQAYRDRYLKSIRSADWTLQFANGAYTQTGNVRADQLISNYIMRLDWAVI